MNTSEIDSRGYSPLQPDFDRITAVRSRVDLQAMVGEDVTSAISGKAGSQVVIEWRGARIGSPYAFEIGSRIGGKSVIGRQARFRER